MSANADGGRFVRGVAELLFRLIGWTTEGTVHEPQRFVIIAAPHTSNWDAVLMVAAAYIFKVRISWFIKREADGTYLRGFANWDNVDGALLRYFLGGPLFWLGMLDLAAPEEQKAPAAFRVRDGENALPRPENGKAAVLSNGKITVPRLMPRAARYQIARFCEWEPEKEDSYHYRVTPASLVRAREQGLKSEQLLGLLQKHAAAALPPPFVRALQRWEANGSEARLERLVVLRLSKPEVLNELRASKAARFLGEILGPTTVIVKDGAQSKVLAALAEMGLMAEIMENDGDTK